MTIRASDEPRLWSDFKEHVQTCPVCADIDVPMCDVGQAFYHSWALADAIAARRDEEGTEDCADDDRRPWEL